MRKHQAAGAGSCGARAAPVAAQHRVHELTTTGILASFEPQPDSVASNTSPRRRPRKGLSSSISCEARWMWLSAAPWLRGIAGSGRHVRFLGVLLAACAQQAAPPTTFPERLTPPVDSRLCEHRSGSTRAPAHLASQESRCLHTGGTDERARCPRRSTRRLARAPEVCGRPAPPDSA